jgi:hypothetical protein
MEGTEGMEKLTDKLTSTHTTETYPAPHGTRRFITVFTRTPKEEGRKRITIQYMSETGEAYGQAH